MLTHRGGRTFVGSLLWLPWSIASWIATLACMTAVFLIGLPLFVFMPFERFQVHLHRAAGLPLYFSFSRLRIQVAPGYDPKRVSMFTQNHVSMFDAHIALNTIRVPMCGLENSAHLRVPGYGWLLRLANAIPVDRGAGRFTRVAGAIADRMRRGISVLVFPEAHRTRDGHVQPFKRGVFTIARDAGLPIVPLAVRGAFRLLPKGAITSRPSLIDVYMGAQVETKGLNDAQLGELIAHVHGIIEAWVERREILDAPFVPSKQSEASAAQ
jgi:1-acyl-sn-glycerol-3-phosphate acyltransferase